MAHKQVSVEYLDGSLIEVDKELVELLSLIWSHGIATYNSCQENQPGSAWIEFATSDDAVKFLNLAASYPEDGDDKPWNTLYGRIAGFGSQSDWVYNTHPLNLGVEEEIIEDNVISKYAGKNDFEFSISIRFPVEDIKKLEQILIVSSETYWEEEDGLLDD